MLLCGVHKLLFPIDDFRFLFHEKRKHNTPVLTVPPRSHLTSCAPTKSNLYLANSLAVVVSDPDLYSLLTFHVPNLMSLFQCLVRTKGSVQARVICISFVPRPIFYSEELSPRPTPKLEDHP